MIATFVDHEGKEIDSFDMLSNLPPEGGTVKLKTGTFTVKKIVYDFTSRSDRHKIEIQVEATSGA